MDRLKALEDQLEQSMQKKVGVVICRNSGYLQLCK